MWRDKRHAGALFALAVVLAIATVSVWHKMLGVTHAAGRGIGLGGVVLLDDATEIRAEHRAEALKRIHTRKLHALRLLAHKIEDDPDVHILKHEDRTLDAINQLGSTKGMHLHLTRFNAGSGAIASDNGNAVPGQNERAPTTVAAVSQIARKDGVKISAQV